MCFLILITAIDKVLSQRDHQISVDGQTIDLEVQEPENYYRPAEVGATVSAPDPQRSNDYNRSTVCLA